MKRRSLLKKASGSAVVGLSVLNLSGSAAADDRVVHGVETDFNPNSNQEIKQFFKQLGEVEKEENRVEVHESLGEPQSNAITNVLSEIEYNTVVNDPIETGPSIQSISTTSVSAQVSAEHWALGYTIWSFEYEVEWDYDYNEVGNIDEMVRPNVSDATWSADGESGSNWLNVDSDEWDGRSQHKFSYIGGGSVPTLEMTPWIELTGNESGVGTVVDANNGN